MPIPENIPSNSINKNFGVGKQREKKTDYDVLPEDMRAIKKKKSAFLSYILPEDVPDIKTYLNSQKDNLIRYIILPKVQQILMDSFATVIGMGNQVRRDNGNSGQIARVSYNKQYNYQNIPTNVTQKRTPVIYQDIYLNSERACTEFKERVSGLFDDQGGFITVLQYMDIAREDTFPEQNNYGWTSMNGFKYRYTVDGWLVTMPYPQPLD